MTRHGCNVCLLIVDMLFLLLPGLATAQVTPPGACTDTWSSVCTSTNTCSETNTQCNVQISHSSNNAIVAYGGTTVSYICVYPGQTVSWQEGEQNAEFVVQFLSTPFTNNQYLFQGSTGTPSPGTVAANLTNGCFKFSIRQQVGATIYPADPKVIVHGTGFPGTQHKKRRKRGTTDEEQPQPQQQ